MQSFFMRTMKTLVILTDTQADLNHRWAHIFEGTFSCIPDHLIHYDTKIPIDLYAVRVMEKTFPVMNRLKVATVA